MPTHETQSNDSVQPVGQNKPLTPQLENQTEKFEGEATNLSELTAKLNSGAKAMQLRSFNAMLNSHAGTVQMMMNSVSPLVEAALDSVKQGKSTDKFKDELAEEVKAKNGPASDGMEYFADAVRKVFKSYYDKDPSDPETALNRAIWFNISDHMSDEKGFDNALDHYALGIQKEAIIVGGFQLHFTTRTKDTDCATIEEITKNLVQKVNGLDEDRLSSIILINFRKDTTDALDTIESTTKGTEHTKDKSTIAKAARKEKVSTIRTYAAAVVNRWKQATNSQKIHIIFDRANLDDAYGKSTANDSATPNNMMAGDEASINKQQIITINLDSERMDRMHITLAHEIAHAMGFNPTDMDAHGHFKDLDNYMEKEGEHGTKLLFDAYYFETLIQHL